MMQCKGMLEEPVGMGDMKPLTETVQDEYSRIASFYDHIVGPLILPVRKEVCRLALQQGFRKVIDICCGTGAQCIMLRRLGFTVAGIDLSPAMLEMARQRSLGQIPLLAADAAFLPFPDGSFDCAILCFALHEKGEASRHRIVAEAKRVLTPNGRIMIVDFETPRGLLSRTAAGFVHLIERSAGRRHYWNFLSYMRAGALQGLLNAHSLRPTATRMFYFSNVSMVVATVPRGSSRAGIAGSSTE